MYIYAPVRYTRPLQLDLKAQGEIQVSQDIFVIYYLLLVLLIPSGMKISLVFFYE